MPLGGNLYIFGDSLSDDGATATQTGQEPVSFPFGGRASNGLVWHEYIRNDLAVAPAAAMISSAPDLEGFLGGSALILSSVCEESDIPELLMGDIIALRVHKHVA